MYEMINEFRIGLANLRDDMAIDTGRGAASSWDEYKFRQGIDRGLESALELFNEIIKKHLVDGDDE